MDNINTIFQVDGDNTEVEGVEQKTCSAVLKQFKNSVIIIKGFMNRTTNIFSPIKLK